MPHDQKVNGPPGFDREGAYRLIDATINSRDLMHDGQSVSGVVSAYSAGRDFVGIERLITVVGESDDPPFETKVNRQGKEELVAHQLVRQFPPERLRFWLELPFPPQYDQSPELKVFRESAEVAGLLHNGAPSAIGLFFGKVKEEVVVGYTDLFAAIRKRVRDPQFEKDCASRKGLASRNFSGALEYVDGHFAFHGALRFARLQIGYIESHRSKIGIDDLHADREDFFNKVRSTSLYHDVVGYLGRIEWNSHRGYYASLYLLLRPSAGSDPEQLVTGLGNYWAKKTTAGRGTFWYGEGDSSIYRNLGVGLIRHDDVDGRKNVFMAIQFMTLSDQYLRVTGNGRRVFFRGTKARSDAGGDGVHHNNYANPFHLQKVERAEDCMFAPPAAPKMPELEKEPCGKPLVLPSLAVPHGSLVFKAAPKRKQRRGEFRLKSVAPMRRARRIPLLPFADEWLNYLANKAVEEEHISMKTASRRSPRRKRTPRSAD